MQKINTEIMIGNAIVELNKENILFDEIYDFEDNFVNSLDNKERFNQKLDVNDIIQFCNVYSYFVSCDKESEMINVDVDKINTMKNVFRNELTEKEIDDMKESVKKHEYVKIIKPFIISKTRF